MSYFWLTMLVFGLGIIAVLAFYAGTLLKQLKSQNLAQAEVVKKKEQALKVHDTKILRSVELIAKAMQQEQCEFSEGCWRLCVLLESLKLSDSHEKQFPAIFSLYNKIKHMPILDARKKIEKRERMKFDLERLKAEAEHSDLIKTNVDELIDYSAQLLTSYKV